MANYNADSSQAQGRPNLAVLQYLQDNWGATQISSAVRVEKIVVTASGTTGVTSTNIPVGAQIVDVIVHPTATVGSGTAKVQVGGTSTDITDAIACNTTNTVGRAATIVQTYKYVTAAGVKVITNADTNKGEIYIYYKV
jgi:hypothetical protein